MRELGLRRHPQVATEINSDFKADLLYSSELVAQQIVAIGNESACRACLQELEGFMATIRTAEILLDKGQARLFKPRDYKQLDDFQVRQIWEKGNLHLVAVGADADY